MTGTVFRIIGVVSFAALLCLGCTGRQSRAAPDELTWDGVTSAYNRRDFPAVLRILDADQADKLGDESRQALYGFLASFQQDDLERAAREISAIYSVVSLDTLNLVEPVRFLPEERESSHRLDIYLSFIEQLRIASPETSTTLRLLETTRILSQRYVHAPWPAPDVAVRLRTLEDELQRSASEATPLGSVRSRVE